MVDIICKFIDSVVKEIAELLMKVQIKHLATHIVGTLHVVQTPKINHGLVRLATRPEKFIISKERNTTELEKMSIDNL